MRTIGKFLLSKILSIDLAPLNNSYRTSDFLSFANDYDDDLNVRSKNYG